MRQITTEITESLLTQIIIADPIATSTITRTGGLSAFQAAKNVKHISGVDYNYLLSLFNYNEAKAQDAVINLKEDKLREMIDGQKGFLDQLDCSGIASENTTNNKHSKSIYEILQNAANQVIKKFSEENPYNPMDKYDELFKDGLPNKTPSSPEEMEENLKYYFSKVLQSKIDEAESAEIMHWKGVYGTGFTLRGGAGASGSISGYPVFDAKGNRGTAISANAGGMWGVPQVSLTFDYVHGKNLDNIFQLNDGSIARGGSVSAMGITAGDETVKPFSEEEEIPAYQVYSFGVSTPSAVPVELHTEAGRTKVIPTYINPDYLIRQMKLDELYELLERYKKDE